MSTCRPLLAASLAALAISAFTAPLSAQPRASQRALAPAAPSPKFFTLQTAAPDSVLRADPLARPTRYQALEVNLSALTARLDAAPWEADAGAPPLRLELPMPDGTVMPFDVRRTDVLHPALQAQFPSIKTFTGVKVGDPKVTLHCDLTALGFRAQVLGPAGLWTFIDPLSRNDTAHCAAYNAADAAHVAVPGCQAHGDSVPVEEQLHAETTGATRRTFRLAVAATGEFTQFYGGTVPSALSAITTAVNRVNGIYERDFTIHFQLVANEASIIYTNPAGDPYTDSDIITMLTENVDNLNATIQSANFDIGQVFGTGGGGVATLGSVCGTNKARGVSSNFGPLYGGINAPMETLTVAHEIGHQFNSPHTWNGIDGGNCSVGQWGTSTAAEPGSGNSVMSYGGLCSASENYVSFFAPRGAYFHAASYARIIRFIENGAACAVSTTTGNQPPIITAVNGIVVTNQNAVPALPAFIVPALTPLQLTMTATDDGGLANLTYNWEEVDVGPQVPLATGDNGASPIFRSYDPVTSPTHYFPTLATVLTGVPVGGEFMPTTSRNLRFRGTVRDNAPGNGGTQTVDIALRTIAGAPPFEVTFPSLSSDFVSGAQQVRWSVGATFAAPISATQVRILLSTDNGQTFPTVLAASVPNTGAATVVFPMFAPSVSTARLKIEPIGNVFYAVSKNAFTVGSRLSTSALEAGGPATFSDAALIGTTNNGNGRIDPGEDSILVSLPVRNAGVLPASPVNGVIASLTPTVTVEPIFASYGTILPTGIASNTPQFKIRVSSAHPCGTPILLRLYASEGTEVVATLDYSLDVGTSGITGAVLSFPYAGAELAIPDGDEAGVDATITVPAGTPGVVSEVRLRFDGAACATNSSSASTTAGLTHDRLGHLSMTLRSPGGVSVPVLYTPGGLPAAVSSNGTYIFGGLYTNDSNNLCDATFAPHAADASIQAALFPGASTNNLGPFTGNYLPVGDFTQFAGQALAGTWTLHIADVRSTGTGTLRAFTLQVVPRAATLCNGVAGARCNPADIAYDNGDPILTSGLGQPNNGTNEGDYNCFFNHFFNPGDPVCDIADDAGNPLPSGGPNNGVNEGDYNCFFNYFFAPCF
ncbi:hypothetical protein BH11PLA1_BH11PLA1_03130 [soil metagenome]